MPLLNVTSNITLSEAEKINALHTLSSAAAELLVKPERYVMTSWTTAKMTMGGSDAPALFLELQSIRLSQEETARLSKELCERICLIVEINPERIYLRFQDVDPALWGWNGKTFAD